MKMDKGTREFVSLALKKGKVFTFGSAVFFLLLLLDLISMRTSTLEYLTGNHLLARLFGLSATDNSLIFVGMFILLNMFLFGVVVLWKKVFLDRN